MPNASALIQRNIGGSQLDSGAQIWVISAQDGTTYSIGFDKEFVKKHLFCDPDPLADMNVKATGLVTSINTYGNLQGVNAEAVPLALDAAALRFLKAKKLVLARVSQGECSLCRQPIGSHAKLCGHCGHLHKKPWANGGACASVLAPTCPCTTWVDTPGGIAAGGALNACAGYVSNDYDQHRTGQGKANPFGGKGGACAGTNTVVLMDEINLQTFKDVVVNAIKAEEALGWTPGHSKTGEGLSLVFGVNTVATIESDDSLATFNNRAKCRGLKVFVRKGHDSVYRIYHLHGSIA